MSQVAAFKGRRVTASAAFLSDVPSNLTILTESAIERILFDGRRAVGVQVSDRACKIGPNSVQDAYSLENSD